MSIAHTSGGQTPAVAKWDASGAPEPQLLQAPDDERARVLRLFDELEAGQRIRQRLHARLELDPRERRSDADVDAAAEADVLRRVLAPGVERVRRVEDARIAVCRTEQHRDLRAARNRHVADREIVRQHPALE